MGVRSAYKAAGIASMVERNIKPRMDPLLLRNYKSMYAWGTEGGNYIFDQVARRSIDEGLWPVDLHVDPMKAAAR